MTNTPRLLLGVLFFTQGLHAVAQVIKLPSVPTGGQLLATVQITATGGSTANLRITLRTLESCGTFNGASQTDTTTDSAGRLSFTMTAGTKPGACTIEGRNGSFAQTAVTTIFRPADVTLTSTAPLQTSKAGQATSFTLKATALALPLWGIPIEIDASPSSGPSGALLPDSRNTDQNGNAVVRVSPNGVPGIFDIAAHSFGASRTLRTFQPAMQPPGPLDPPGRSVRAREFPAEQGALRVSIVDGPAACQVVDALYLPDSPEGQLPFGMTNFPLGQVQVTFDNCIHPNLTLKVEYPQPIARDTQLFARFPVAGGVALFQQQQQNAGTISGNAATFAFAGDVLSPITLTSNRYTVNFGFAKAGRPFVAPPTPAVQGLWWAGLPENGWGMSLVQSATGMFGVIYGYDDAGKPTWWVLSGGTWDAQRRTFTGDAYSPHGTPWQAYDASLFTAGDRLGSARLTFSDASNATLDYTINGLTGHKVITKQVFGANDPAPVANAGGMWWGNIAQSGWGVVVVQQGATLFSVWYTYDDFNRPTWYMMPGGKWTTADSFDGRLYRTRGSPWLGRTYDPAVLQVIDVGAYRLRYVGTGLQLEYTIEGRSGTLPLNRFTF